ncbi:MAG: co-chaperone GroES [Planctomycetota bacterium]|jgi:chaperonin GroES
MAVKPLDDRVLIKRLDAEEQTSGGILLPDSAREKQLRGRIEAVGEGRRTDDGTRLPLSVAVGDVVIFGKYAGTEIKIAGDQHTIMRESELLGVLEA